jgi:Flp pilus assembly protein CpaB
VSSRRTLILIGAVVIGGLAAFLTLSYVRGVENRSNEAGQLVEVLVVAGPIAKGTGANEAIDSKLIVMDKRRRDDLPANPVRRTADILGQVAALDLGGGEIVTTSMFVPSTALNGSKSASLDKGNVAITISVDQAAGVAGLVQPGDSVNILARYCSVASGGASSAPAAGGGNTGGCALSRTGASSGGGAVGLGSPASYLFQAVKVLAVGQSLGQPVAATAPAADGAAAPETTAPQLSPLVTVQLPPNEAQLLASLRDADLYLTLNRPDYEPIPVPFVNSLPALPGETGQQTYPPTTNGPTGQ